ncbi:class I SAM-dependent methyltransferase [Maricaulis sp. MIT060901]|uniref:class I SAM-dependent methyltransferase n=1 Tax=Maricaulis sp. MIT060901 TaxID=3096993 RepID=UPI00399A7C02
MKPVYWLSAATLMLAACSGGSDQAEDQQVVSDAPQTRWDTIMEAVDDEQRPDEDRVLDVNRHPAELLDFAGVQRGWVVADIVPGGGYYSRILSTAVGDMGRVYSFNPSWVAEQYGDANEAMNAMARRRANLSHHADDLEDFGTGFDRPLDAVFMVLFYHDTGYDGTDRAAMNQAIFNALAPGGVFLVVDHHAVEGSGLDAVQTLHRIESAVVMQEVMAAGFEFVSESDMLANPEDPRDISVFAPNIRRNTDRFVYLFRKPE